MLQTEKTHSQLLLSESKPLNKRGRKKIEKSVEIKPDAVPGIKVEPIEMKKRGRKPKNGTAICKTEPLDGFGDVIDAKQRKLTDLFPVKKKRDRFNGMTEDEVMCRTLPDHLAPDLDILIIGINPGLTAAYVGHHYAGPGNHFWKCLFLSGLIPEPMNAFDDFKLKEYGIGFTNIVERTSRGSADLTKKEIKEGAEILITKIHKYKPKIAVFNGKGIYEVFCGHKKFFIGKQPEPIQGTDTVIFVMPSSSARFTQLPRAVDKVPFYVALKKIKDHLNGTLRGLDESEVTFPDLELKVEPKKERLDKEIKMESEVDFEVTSANASRKKKIKAEPLAGEGSEICKATDVASKNKKRRSKKGVAAPLADDPCPSTMVAIVDQSIVKSEFSLTSASNSSSGNNGQFMNFSRNSSCHLPSFYNASLVKEEVPLDLSRYGVMPSSSSDINKLCPSGKIGNSNDVHAGNDPLVANSGMNLSFTSN